MLTKEQQEALRVAFNNWIKCDKALVQMGTGDPNAKEKEAASTTVETRTAVTRK